MAAVERIRDAVIRPFDLEADFAGVSALCDWAWFPPRSLEGWRWLARAPQASAGPLGWVCEAERGVVAVLGAFNQKYQLGQDSFLASCGHTLVVRPEARGMSKPLIKSILQVPAVPVVQTFNANHRSARIYKQYGFEAWPHETASMKYVWRLRPTVMALEKLRRWRAEKTEYRGVRDGPEHFVDQKLWREPAVALETGVQSVDLNAPLGEAFDRLWTGLAGEGRMLAVRDRAALRWRLDDPDNTRAPLLLTWEADGELAGYLMAVFSKGSEIEPVALEIIDLIALKPFETHAIPALLASALRIGRATGVARVRLSVVAPALLPLIEQVAGGRPVVHHNHCHVYFGPDDSPERRAAWYVTPFDGDLSFTVRPPPRRQA